MAAQFETVRAAGAQVSVIGPGAATDAAHLADRLKTPFPVLADPSGGGLDALGCTRVMGPLRRSGTLVVDAAGMVRYARQTANAAAALAWGEVFHALQAARG